MNDITFKYFVYALFCISSISSFELLSTVMFTAIYLGWKHGKSNYESCNDVWRDTNISGLKYELQNKLYGQHLAQEIPNYLLSHIVNESPEKALVMKFVGQSGSGKNYVSKIIAKHLYQKGTGSAFVHLYIGSNDFPHKFLGQLQGDIAEFTMVCDKSLFIFDDIDHMWPELMTVLKPFLICDGQDSIKNCKRNIFIFLSNIGDDKIAEITYSVLKSDQNRNSLVMSDFEDTLKNITYNKGVLKPGEVKEDSLIDFYVPFLPLEKEHVKLCVADVLKGRNHPVTDEILEKVSSQFFDDNIFSPSGCKLVAQKTDVFGGMF